MRADIVAQARTWLGAPYHHQARHKVHGVDCVGLVIGVARELGIVAPDFDVQGYPRAADGRFLSHCDAHMTKIPQADMAPGDCVAVAFARHAQHIGIVGDYLHGGLSIIHAVVGRGVVETRLLFGPHMRFVAGYRL